MTRQILKRSRSQMCAELEYDIWNFCSLNPFRLHQGLKTLFRINYDKDFIVRQEEFGSIFTKADKKLSKILMRRRSYYGSIILLKRKLRFFFGYVSQREMSQRIVQIKKYKKENASVGAFNVLFRIFESRLDFLSIRLRYVFNLKDARAFIMQGFLAVNDEIHVDPSFLVQIGDIIRPSSFKSLVFFYKTYYLYWFGEYILNSGFLKGRFLSIYFNYLIFRHRSFYLDNLIYLKSNNFYDREVNRFGYSIWQNYYNFYKDLTNYNWLKLLCIDKKFLSNLQNYSSYNVFFPSINSFGVKFFFKKIIPSNIFDNFIYSLGENNKNEVKLNNFVSFRDTIDFLSFYRLLYIFFYLVNFFREFKRLINKIFVFLKYKNILLENLRLERVNLNNRKYLIINILFYESLLVYYKSLLYNFLFYKLKGHILLIDQIMYSFKIVVYSLKLGKNFYRDNFNLNFILLFSYVDNFICFFSEIIKELRNCLLEIKDDNNSFYSFFTSVVFFSKRFLFSNFDKIFYNVFFDIYYKVKSFSWGFIPLFVFCSEFENISLEEDFSLYNLLFEQRLSISTWSINLIEKMHNYLKFLEISAHKRINFYNLRKREYSFYLLASSSSSRDIFFSRFKKYSLNNFFLFSFYRLIRKHSNEFINFNLNCKLSRYNFAHFLNLNRFFILNKYR